MGKQTHLSILASNSMFMCLIIKEINVTFSYKLIFRKKYPVFGPCEFDWSRRSCIQVNAGRIDIQGALKEPNNSFPRCESQTIIAFTQPNTPMADLQDGRTSSKCNKIPLVDLLTHVRRWQEHDWNNEHRNVMTRSHALQDDALLYCRLRHRLNCPSIQLQHQTVKIR